jgi:hypothetical protein
MKAQVKIWLIFQKKQPPKIEAIHLVAKEGKTQEREVA